MKCLRINSLFLCFLLFLTTLCDVNLAVNKGGKLSFPFGSVNTNHLNTDEQPGHNNTLTSASISSALISRRAAPSPLSRCLRNSLKELDVWTSAGSLKPGGLVRGEEWGGVNAKCSSSKWDSHGHPIFWHVCVLTNRKAVLLCEACSPPFKQPDSSVQPNA